MQVEYIKLESIKPYKNNSKKHPQEQIEQIKKSIKDLGFNDPIGIDENNTIIEGHGRFIALQQLGHKEAPCIRITGLTKQQKKAYILVHNKLTMNTGFDMETLEKEIEQIKSIDLGVYDFEVYKPEEIQEIQAEGNDSEIFTIVLNLNEEQYNTLMELSERIEKEVPELHAFGNPNKRSNLINEIVYQWAVKEGII